MVNYLNGLKQKGLNKQFKETSFMTASIHLLNFSSTGQTDDLKTDSEIDLVKKATCSSTNFEVGKQYLIMTAESIKIRMNRGYK